MSKKHKRNKLHSFSDDQEQFCGSGVVLQIDRSLNWVVCRVGDIDIDVAHFPSQEEQLRAMRLEQLKRGEEPQPLPQDAFHADLTVIPGPNASAAVVVRQLRRLASEIEKHGLYIGQGTERGERYWESTDGEIEVDGL